MTVQEMFYNKYKDYMKNISSAAWKNHKYYAERLNIPVHEHIFMSLEITQMDLKENDMCYFGSELEKLHKDKCIVSNRHRQEHGHIDRYWLTKKGYKKLFAE